MEVTVRNPAVHGGRAHAHFAGELVHADGAVKIAAQPEQAGGNALNMAGLGDHAAEQHAVRAEQELEEDFAADEGSEDGDLGRLAEETGEPDDGVHEVVRRDGRR